MLYAKTMVGLRLGSRPSSRRMWLLVTKSNTPAYPAGDRPIAVAADPSGKFLFVTSGDSTVSVYDVGGKGGLSALAGSPFGPTGNEPRAIAIVGQIE